MNLFTQRPPQDPPVEPDGPRQMDAQEHVHYLLGLAEDCLKQGLARRAALHLAQATLKAVEAANDGYTFDQLAVYRRVARVGKACGPEAIA